MTLFIESLKRLFRQQKIDKKKLDELLSNKKITQDEYKYIMGGGN